MGSNPIFSAIENRAEEKSFSERYRGIAQLVEQWSPKPRAVGSIPTAPVVVRKSEKTISFLAFSCFIHDNKMSAERAFYC